MKLVENDVANKRLKEFQILADRIKKNYRKKLIKAELNILFENKLKNGNQYFGRDEHYNSVIVDSNNDLTGKILKVKINDFNHNTLFGEIIDNKKIISAA